MADETYTQLQVFGRYEPEPADTFDPAAHDTAVPVTGNYVVYVNIDGAYRSIAQYRASGLFADIERAKQAAGSDPFAQPAQPQQPDQPQPAQPQQPDQPQG